MAVRGLEAATIERPRRDSVADGLNTTNAMKKDLLLAIDVGTGSVRAALISVTGETVAFSAQEHDQIVPEFGWSEQRPESWWEGAAASVRTVLASS